MPLVLDGATGASKVPESAVLGGLGFTPQNSQFLVSQVCFFARQTAPDGFLKCNGAAVSRTVYADLFAAIGTTYGVGNGSTTFTLPDLRGEFLRCWDDGRAVDTGRAFGSAQGGAIQSHNHLMPIQRLAVRVGTGNTAETATDYFSGNRYTYDTGGTETRPRNVALLACIKY